MVFKRCHLHGLVPVLGPVILTAACTAQAPTGAPAAAQPASPSVPAQPGIKWTDQELQSAVAPVRAGRKLTPASWPNRAKIAVCLSFDVDNESFTLARGTTAPAVLSGRRVRRNGRPAARARRPRSESDRRLVLHSSGQRDAAPPDGPGDRQAGASRGRCPRLDSREPARVERRGRGRAADEPSDRLPHQGDRRAACLATGHPLGPSAIHHGVDPQSRIHLRQQPDGDGRAGPAHGGRSAHGADRAARRIDLGRCSVLRVGSDRCRHPI